MSNPVIPAQTCSCPRFIANLKPAIWKRLIPGILFVLGFVQTGSLLAATTAAPTSLSWASVAVGSAGGPKAVTLTNGDSTAITISSIAVSGTDAADFTIYENTCSTSLAASANCTVTMLFKPSAMGTRTATLTFTDTGGGSPQTVALSGTGKAASSSVSVSPTALAFGSVTANSGSASLTDTLTNGTAASITLSSIAISSGADPADFTISSRTCGTTLAANASCTVTVLFKPSATGTRTANLTFTNSAGNSPQTATLSGTGTAATATVTLSPTTLAFGSVTANSGSASLTTTLTNGSSASITLSSIAISGTNSADFTISSKTCSTSLAASAKCTVTVLFKPSATGARSATLTFTDSASNSPQTATLSGTGTSAAGTVTLSPASLAFGSVTANSGSASLTTTLSNGTSASISISSIAVSGTNAADFTISSKTCSTSLAANANCTVTVLFKPAATGSFTATLTFTDSASNSPQTAALSGTGTSSGGGTPTGSLTTSPSSLTWSAIGVGSTSSQQTVTLHNSGSSSVSLTTVALTSTDPGDFTIASKTCGSSLAAGASCTVTLSFSPKAEGTRVALLSFTDSATYSPQTVELSGTGGSIGAQTASITVNFGSRSNTQVTIPANILGVEYMDSLPDSASRNIVVQAGIQMSRLHANVPAVFAKTTPDWTKIDGSIKVYKALGVHPILIIDQTPPWLYPSPLVCKSAPDTSVPSDLTKWGEMAASIVNHMDTTFPGVVQDYEIWNEPNNTGALCSSNKLDDYLDIYAAAGPLMRAQAKTDGATIHIGGPASAGVAWPSLLTDARTAPYVDFYSYHLYLSTPTQIKDGMTWDGTGGKPSLLSMILNGTSGEQARYTEALSYVKAGKTPLGAKMPVYFSEFNDNWAFEADCCRNDPTYSPLFNSMVVAETFNSVYSGANQVPSKMMYYAAAQKPFCILGVANSAMDCTAASSNADLTPYPQLYTYQLISAPGYLDLVDGGHMATSVTLSSAAKSQGLVATAYYTASTDSILIINPENSSFGGVTVQLSNPGFTNPSAILFTVNSENRRVSTWPASLVSVSGGVQATFDMPAHSVLAIALKAN